MKHLILSALLLLNSAVFAADTTEQELSLYQLDINLEDQSGATFKLDAHRNHPVLISMFYASCPHVCPLTINTIQKTEAALSPEQRQNLRVILVSLDYENDTPAFLTKVASKQDVDTSRWTLARTPDSSVRKLAATLGVRYRKLPDGEFNHSTLIALLDKDGVRIASSDQLNTVNTELLETLKSQLH